MALALDSLGERDDAIYEAIESPHAEKVAANSPSSAGRGEASRVSDDAGSASPVP